MVIHATEILMKKKCHSVMEYEREEASNFPQITIIQQHWMQLKKTDIKICK
jgi:hypothetical protein